MAVKKETNNNKLCAILAYVLIGIIWFFADEKMKKDKFVKFHVKQGLVLLIFSFLWSVALSILSPVLFFLSFVLLLLNYVPLVLTVIGIIHAINNEEKEIPVIGKYSKKFNF